MYHVPPCVAVGVNDITGVCAVIAWGSVGCWCGDYNEGVDWIWQVHQAMIPCDSESPLPAVFVRHL